ncbi:MAG: LLM class flavin-dependent oxidoreductase [Thaumarchaeota archaeon]|nr:LLM class flavin-dependent oxidoreductase [Nitrososphaerota archaeon]
MKLALGFNPVMSAREMAGLAVKAEALGYDSMWMHESLFQRDVVTYIAAMTSATKTIRVGSGIMNTFTRHPVAAASTFATLSELSGGRVIFGLGLGSFPTIPLIGQQIFPVEKTRPLRRMKEYLEVVRRVWSGEKVEYEGEFFKVHNLTLGFKVERQIPVFLASMSPKTQSYAATVADGVILSPALSTVKVTKAMIGNVVSGEARSGRKVERASYMMTSVDPDPAKAKEAVRNYYFFVYQLSDVVKPEALLPYGVTEVRLAPMKEAWKRGDVAEAKRLIPDEAIDALAVVGDEDHVRDRVKEYLDVGVTLPILMPIGNVEYAMSTLAPR